MIDKNYVKTVPEKIVSIVSRNKFKARLLGFVLRLTFPLLLRHHNEAATVGSGGFI